MRSLVLTTCLLLLAACGGAPDRFVPAPQARLAQQISSKFASIEVVEVSLPNYAAGEAVAINDEGALVLSDLLWADDPTRAVTLSLTRNIKESTGARVASEPWPFDEPAEARVDVRVEELIVEGDLLLLSGQYFVGDMTGEGRDHAHLFSLAEPLFEMSERAIAQGRARLVARLAFEIAKKAL